MMSEYDLSQSKIKYDIYVTAAACSYRGCTLAVGTSDSLVLLYQIGKRGFGDVPEDEQAEEDYRRNRAEIVMPSRGDAGEGFGYASRTGGA